MMQDLVTLVRETGASAWLLLLLTAAGWTLSVVLAVLSGSRRVPVTAWLGVPGATAALGCLTAIWNVRRVLQVLPMIRPEQEALLAQAGLAELMGGLVLGFGLASALLIWSAGLAGLASLVGQGPEARVRPGAPQLAGGVGVLGAVGLVVAAGASRHGAEAGWVGLLLLLHGLATAISGLRRTAPPAERTGLDALTQGVLAVLGLASATAATAVWARLDGLAALAHADPAMSHTILVIAASHARSALWAGGAATAVAAVLAGIAAGPALQGGLSRARGLDLLACGGVVLLVLASAGLWQLSSRPLWVRTEEGRFQVLRPYLSGLARRILPDGLPTPDVEGWGGTVLVRAGAGWQILQGDALVAVALPLDLLGDVTLVVPGSLPVNELTATRWMDPSEAQRDGVVRLTILTAASDGPASPLDLQGVYLHLAVPGRHVDLSEPVWDALSLEGRQPLVVSGLEVKDPSWLYVDPGAAGQVAAAVRARRATSLLLVPGPGWTVQSLVTLCLAGQGAASPREYDRPPFLCLVDDAPAVPLPLDPLGDGTGSLSELRVRIGGSAIILGAIAQEDVKAGVIARLPAIGSCAEEADQPLGGKLTIKFVIAKDGAVSRAEVRSTTLNNPRLERCVVRQFYRASFPPPRGGAIAIVSYPLEF